MNKSFIKQRFREGDKVYVIRLKFKNKKVEYYLDEMTIYKLCGNTIWCGKKNQFNIKHNYCYYFKPDRVFKEHNEAKNQMLIRQRDYNIKKQIELEFEKRIKEVEKK